MCQFIAFHAKFSLPDAESFLGEEKYCLSGDIDFIIMQ